MLHTLDESLESLLRAEVPLARGEIDVSFDVPGRTFAGKVVRPTVSLFLWDVRHSDSSNQAGTEFREIDGRRVQVPALPRLDFRYLVTAWAAEVRSEHHLLGSLLASLLSTTSIPAEHLRGPFALTTPEPSLTLRHHRQSEADVWGSLGVEIRPALDLLVTAPVDPGLAAEVGPPVERLAVLTGDMGEGGRRERWEGTGGRTDAPPGSIVRSRRGTDRVGDDGRYLVHADPSEAVVIEGAAAGAEQAGEG